MADLSTSEDDESVVSANYSFLGPEDKSSDARGFKNESEVDSLLAKRETRYVLRLRILVFVALLIAALAVSLTVYFITTKAEGGQFEAGFEGNAQKLIDSFGEIIEIKIGALANLAVTFTEYARDRNLTWPYVTMSDFQQRAVSARALSNSLFLELLPIVTNETRTAWEAFALQEKGWLDEGRRYQEKIDVGIDRRLLSKNGSLTGDNVLSFVAGDRNGTSTIADQIFVLNSDYVPVPDPGNGPYFPIWQSSPILTSPRDLVNYNLLTYPVYAPFINRSSMTGEIELSGFHIADPGGVTNPDLATSFYAFILSFAAGEIVDYLGDPMSTIYVPVFDSFDDDKKVVAVVVAVINWAAYFESVLPPNSQPLTMVLENSCEGHFTYRVQGEKVQYLGQGNQHDPRVGSYVMSTSSNRTDKVHSTAGIDYRLFKDQCVYRLHVYPTTEMYNFYYTNVPVLITVSIVLIFIFTAFMFFVYDRLVERRQSIVMKTAVKSSQIVSSLFPKQIRERLFADENQDGPVHGTKTKLKSFLSGSIEEIEREAPDVGTKPIADLFPETTILFADIVGFTAWSSVREPSQVFSLLESLFRSFDACASRRRVFKVETVGDCYVAVTGLPDPRKDHAIAMVRFARDCLMQMSKLLTELEVALGPGTADLRMRVGIHSGPVTAGVLRGDRSRFQLFGDTMNTAARMESTGKPGRIHMSFETANLLVAAGKEKWVQPREDEVHAKGKGILKTFWLVFEDRLKSGDLHSSNGGESECDISQPMESQLSLQGTQNRTIGNQDNSFTSIDKHRRLIDWNVEILHRLLRLIVARRESQSPTKKINASNSSPPSEFAQPSNRTVLDEVCEVIALPSLDVEQVQQLIKPDSIVLPEAVIDQLQSYVTGIASLYRNNPFHNFEHASHVTMSVVKLLSRIVAPSDLDFADGKSAWTSLHDHTYGITSDPLTQFACVLSALIHDADHSGVPNAQLIEENSLLAEHYKGKSIAEQNSVDLCWALLQDDRFAQLRGTIYTTDAELQRFRQLIVNSVMATDIMDKDLKTLRNSRWEKAFAPALERRPEDSEACNSECALANRNRRATIVIEHLIQASDVAHTMQHWHIYRKWNQRLFEEMYVAYIDGRAASDPSANWYKGELGFFDFYILPLAQKLKDCGVFGVSSDEYMNYAAENRREWESRGRELVAEMAEKARTTYRARERASSEAPRENTEALSGESLFEI